MSTSPSSDDNKESCSNNEDAQMTNIRSLACDNCDELFPNVAHLKLHRDSCDSSHTSTLVAVSGQLDRHCTSSMNRPDLGHEDPKMVDVSKEEHINEVDEAIKQDAVNNNLHRERTADPDDESGDVPIQDVKADVGQEAEEKEERDVKQKDESRSIPSNPSKDNHQGEDAEEEEEDGSESNADLSSSFAQSHVTLEALQNTKVAVAQFAANALAAGIGNGDNEAALKDLAVLHSTLFQLQHQHVFQLQLIQQLQSQLSMNHRGPKGDEEKEDLEGDEQKHMMDNQSDGFSEKRDEEEDEDFGKLEPEVIINR